MKNLNERLDSQKDLNWHRAAREDEGLLKMMMFIEKLIWRNFQRSWAETKQCGKFDPSKLQALGNDLPFSLTVNPKLINNPLASSLLATFREILFTPTLACQVKQYLTSGATRQL